MSGLKINVQECEDIVRVELEGHLDAHTFEQLEDRLEQLFGQNKYHILVDLHRLRYISSAGAGVFIGSLGTCQDNEGNIALIAPTPEVKEIFDLLGVFHIFPVADTLEEGMEMLAT